MSCTKIFKKKNKPISRCVITAVITGKSHTNAKPMYNDSRMFRQDGNVSEKAQKHFLAVKYLFVGFTLSKQHLKTKEKTETSDVLCILQPQKTRTRTLFHWKTRDGVKRMKLHQQNFLINLLIVWLNLILWIQKSGRPPFTQKLTCAWMRKTSLTAFFMAVTLFTTVGNKRDRTHEAVKG